MPKQQLEEIFLTETILTIHNDVQSAVDFINDVARQESSELGKSTAIMGIEKLKIKLPLALEVLQSEETEEIKPPVLNIEKIKSSLAARKGLLVKPKVAGKKGIYSKIRVSKPAAAEPAEIAEQPKQQMFGEIEIVFSPFER